jgi:hypothetical protein
MDTLRSLNARELRALNKIDRRLAWGRVGFGLFVTAVGFAGGLAVGGVMAMLMAMSHGGGQMPLPGYEAHTQLDHTLSWLVSRFGLIPGVILLGGIAFGGLIAPLGFGMLWRDLVKRHAELAYRAVAFGQFKPRFASPLLRRYAVPRPDEH